MFENAGQIYEWLQSAEAMHAEVAEEYRQNREYYENKQKPNDVPDDIAYIVKNLIWSYVNLQVSKVVGGKIDKTLKTTEAATTELNELLDDILEKNKFQEELLELAENHRQVEGLVGWKVIYNPFKQGPYGLGFPELHVLSPLTNEILLDPNSTDGTHRDDRARAHRVQIPLAQALRNPKWRRFADVLPSHGRRADGHGREMMIDVYEIEFRHTFYFLAYYDPAQNSYVPIQDFIPAADQENFARQFGSVNQYDPEAEDFEFLGDFADNPDRTATAMELLKAAGKPDPQLQDVIDNAVAIEQEIFFTCKVINKTLLVEPPEPSGFAGFTIIPSMHTLRHYGRKLPMSPVAYLRDTQDRINATSSIMFQEAKKALKNPIILLGVDQNEFIKTKRHIAGVGEVFFWNNPNARLLQPSPSQLTPALIQQYQIDMDTFELVGNTNEPDRGQPVDLSGKAIVNLQARADLPMYVPSIHLANSLVEVFRRLLECVINKIDKPFWIERKIEGETRKIYFNYPVHALPEDAEIEDDAYIVDDVLNPLYAMRVPDVGVDIDTNTLATEQEEIQKAVALFDRGQLAPQHLHRAFYPQKWAETLQAAEEYNQALQLVAQLQQLSPEGQQVVMEQIQQVAIADQQAAQIEKQMQGSANGFPRR